MPPQTVDRDLDNARRRATHTQTGLDAKNEAGDEHAGNALFAGRRDAIHEIPVPGRPPRPQRVALKFERRANPGIFAGWAPRVIGPREWRLKKEMPRRQRDCGDVGIYGGRMSLRGSSSGPGRIRRWTRAALS